MKKGMNFKIAALLSVSLAASAFVSCIQNDIPYPKIVADITAFKVSGQKGDAIINATERSVTVDLADTVDLKNVILLQLEVSNEAVITPEPASAIDLSEPFIYTLTTYQDYLWTINATQTVERYIRAENQIGNAIFDEYSKIALVTVSSETDRADMHITDMKIGPEGSEITPDFTTVTDFSSSVEFTWTYKNRSETWTVKVVKSSQGVVTGEVNAFARHAIVEGEFKSGSASPAFLYRKSSDSEWTTFSDGVTVNGGAFSATITGLEPSTEYVVKASAGGMEGAEVSFTTEAAIQVENMDFENWIKEGKSWFPNLDLSDAHYFWDTGNKGANTLSEKNPTTPEESVVISGKSAKMASTAVLGIFAAGNIYTGKYVSTTGVGARLDFGVPFTSRPTGLKGYYYYTPGVVDKADDSHSYLLGQNDTCHIYAVLADWGAPFPLNTTTGELLDLDNNSGIIAIASLKDGKGTDGFVEFNIEFDYRSLERKPTHILIVASASMFGDYFTGSTSSVLYADEFELTYE